LFSEPWAHDKGVFWARQHIFLFAFTATSTLAPLSFPLGTMDLFCYQNSILHEITNPYLLDIRNVWRRNRVTQNGAKLLWSRKKLTTKMENNLGLSSCAVPRSAVMCVVAYFRRTELLSEVQERSGIG